ncbi:MAG: NADP-dependent phosphogluconate dehydrogenase, partial [Pseudomonadota bacterium]
MGPCHVGLIGLAVMGQNFVINMARHGFRVAVFNRTIETTHEFLGGKAQGLPIEGSYSLQELINRLQRPRKIILLVKAGKAVDDVLESLIPLLERGDLLIDSGNSYFRDTERRMEMLSAKGIHYVGMGISGGEMGALLGPSIMPGGHKEAVDLIMPILTKVAAQNPAPCVAYMGKKGAGHFVKMAHNGIEYADMQLIAEIYDLARYAFDLSISQIQEFFESLKKGPLDSYLIEITAKILKREDDHHPGEWIGDYIQDVAEGKGTGIWTAQESLTLGVPTPSIAAAVFARNISTYRKRRNILSQIYPAAKRVQVEVKEIFESLEQAMLAGKILCYAQGMDLLSKASSEYQYDLNLAEVARIWRGGCIIRSVLLNDIAESFYQGPQLSMLESPQFRA